MSPSFSDESRGPIDWESLLQFLGQFEDVKRHVLQASGEMILAFKALLDQVLKVLEEEQPGNRQKWEFLYALQYSLGFLSARLNANPAPKRNPDDTLRAKREVFESILAVLDREIQLLEGDAEAKESMEEPDKIRLGAFMAIRNVLRREYQKHTSTPESASPKSTPKTPTSSGSPANC